MVTGTINRLPGFRFEVVPPPLSDVLPRMDIAVFVGFAEAGPINTPVVIEDLSHFRTIFGKDLPIAYDQIRGEMVSSYLGLTVSAFFKNGGRRCWIVRVAGKAKPNYFQIPGLMEARHDKNRNVYKIIPVFAKSRSEGSWSDNIQVGTTLHSTAIEVIKVLPGQNVLHCSPSSPKDIVNGDLLRLTYPIDDNSQIVQIAAVESVRLLKEEIITSQSNKPLILRVSYDEVICYESDRTGQFTYLQKQSYKQGTKKTVPECERLNFDLKVSVGKDVFYNIRNLGFTKGHPRFWNELPTDEELFRIQKNDNPYLSLWKEAENPRFPLAGKRQNATVYFPLFMPCSADSFLGPIKQKKSPLERNGLAKFKADLFLDRHLKGSSIEDLMVKADYHRYQSKSVNPFLEGIHAAIGIEEATIISVPDIIHRGWKEIKTHAIIQDDLHKIEPKLPPEPHGGCFTNCDEISVTGPLPEDNNVSVNEESIQFVVEGIDAYSDKSLLDVHTDLLRMCAARGDMLAILSMPVHYLENDAISHTKKLKSIIDNNYILSYGGIYYPWLITGTGESKGNLKYLPPDGAISGIIAYRANSRGAWIAPANEPIKGVVSLKTIVKQERWLDMQESQINLIRQEPSGFVPLNADTLCEDDDNSFYPINVRRLLILLKRYALKVGTGYVFEPNNESFHRMVYKGFDAMMQQMFVRGAFAGRRTEEAYQVNVGRTLNSRQAMEQGEQGRFIVELKVAPSLPMKFITIRLVQTGDHLYIPERV